MKLKQDFGTTSQKLSRAFKNFMFKTLDVNLDRRKRPVFGGQFVNGERRNSKPTV